MTTAKKKIIAVLAIILIASSMSTAVYADDRIGTPDGSGDRFDYRKRARRFEPHHHSPLL